MSQVLELAQSLVRLNTVNPPGDETAAAELLGDRLESAGFRLEWEALGPRRANLIARLPGRGDGPSLGFTGHLDTVPLGDATWARDPLGGEVADGRLHGRGSSDMKGGVAALVIAAERAGRRGGGAAGLEVVLCAGEETGCDGAALLARRGVLGRVGALLVAEPTSNYPLLGHKGALWIRAGTRGQTAHGSMPHLGVNAVYAMARAITKLERLSLTPRSHPLLGAPSLSVGRVAGGLNVNSVPDACSAELDVRTIPGLSSEDVLATLAAELGDEVSLEPFVDTAAMATDPGDPWVAEVFEVMGALIGETPEPRGATYFTDASVLTPAYGGPPTVVCGPGEPDQAHVTDEWCSVARLEAAVEGYFELARRWLGL